VKDDSNKISTMNKWIDPLKDLRNFINEYVWR
jgi:hypothetical protein